MPPYDLCLVGGAADGGGGDKGGSAGEQGASFHACFPIGIIHARRSATALPVYYARLTLR
jgi:hypothetical protein